MRFISNFILILALMEGRNAFAGGVGAGGGGDRQTQAIVKPPTCEDGEFRQVDERAPDSNQHYWVTYRCHDQRWQPSGSQGTYVSAAQSRDCMNDGTYWQWKVVYNRPDDPHSAFYLQAVRRLCVNGRLVDRKQDAGGTEDEFVDIR